MKNILVAAVTILLSLVSAIKQAVLFSLIPIQPRFLVVGDMKPSDYVNERASLRRRRKCTSVGMEKWSCVQHGEKGLQSVGAQKMV